MTPEWADKDYKLGFQDGTKGRREHAPSLNQPLWYRRGWDAGKAIADAQKAKATPARLHQQLKKEKQQHALEMEKALKKANTEHRATCRKLQKTLTHAEEKISRMQSMMNAVIKNPNLTKLLEQERDAARTERDTLAEQSDARIKKLTALGKKLTMLIATWNTENGERETK